MKKRKFVVLMALLLVALMGYQASPTAAKEPNPTEIVLPEQTTLLRQDQAMVAVSPSDAQKVVHQVPLVPVIIDGQKHKPEEITKYNGRALYFVVDPQAQKEGALYAFTSIDLLKNYMVETHGLPEAAGEVSTNHTSNDPFSYFPEHTGYGGAWLALRVGYGITNLGGWNDRVSSILATPYGRWTALYEHSNFGGTQLWFYSGSDVWDLRSYGWNDRASSLGVWY
jgi:hypothetical protein